MASTEASIGIQPVRSRKTQRRHQCHAFLIDVMVVALLFIIIVALLLHQQHLDASKNVYYESIARSSTPYFVRDSVHVPPTYFLEMLRVQKARSVVNPAEMSAYTHGMTDFHFPNQSYEGNPEMQALVNATASDKCMAATSGSGYGYCQLSAPLALAAFESHSDISALFPSSLLQQLAQDMANGTFDILVLSSYGYSVQTELNIVKLRDGNPDTAIAVSLCRNDSTIEVVNGYDRVVTSQCIHYGNIKTYEFEFVQCTNATFTLTLYDQVCGALLGEHGQAMRFQGQVELHTGEIVKGANGILVPRNGGSRGATGYMLLPTDAVVSVENIAKVARRYVSIRGVGLRYGQIIGLAPTMNVFEYQGVGFLAAAVLQMLLAMTVLRYTRRFSLSSIDTLTIYNRLGSSVVVYAQIIYGASLSNGVSYALSRLYGASKAGPMLVIETCMYTLQCLIWHHLVKKVVGMQAVQYRHPVVIAIPILFGVPAILYRTIVTQIQGYAFDETQRSGIACVLPGKFCYQTSYHRWYQLGFQALPIVTNTLLYLGDFGRRLRMEFRQYVFKKSHGGRVTDKHGERASSKATTILLPFEVLYGSRRVADVCGDYDYLYIPAESQLVGNSSPQEKTISFQSRKRPRTSNVSEPEVFASLGQLPPMSSNTTPSYLVTMEAVELCGFLFLNQRVVIRQKDVLIAFMAWFFPFAHVSIMVWFVHGTCMSAPRMLSGNDFRAVIARHGFFNATGSALGGYLNYEVEVSPDRATEQAKG